MQSLPNIDKSGFRRGEYIGYSGGRVWRVRKTANRYWSATCNDDCISGTTLAEISAKLAERAIAKKCPACGGAGAINGSDCAACYGGGEVIPGEG